MEGVLRRVVSPSASRLAEWVSRYPMNHSPGLLVEGALHALRQARVGEEFDELVVVGAWIFHASWCLWRVCIYSEMVTGLGQRSAGR
jgi:hypothetical protein